MLDALCLDIEASRTTFNHHSPIGETPISWGCPKLKTMELRQLEYFVAVVEAGSFTRAAERLHMSQPPLSVAVNKLERELGVKLLERTSRGVTPTAAGSYLLNTGGHLILQRNRMAAMVGRIGEGLAGELMIGSEPLVIEDFLAGCLSTFIAEAPSVHLQVIEQPPGAVLEALAQGRIDLACLPTAQPATFARQLPEGLTSKVVTPIPLELAVPAARAGEANRDLRGWGRWILPLRIVGFPALPEAVDHLLGPEIVDVIKVSTPQTALPLVAAGMGVTLTTRGMVESHRGVSTGLTDIALPSLYATFVWRTQSGLSPVSRRFLEVAFHAALDRSE